MSEILTDTANVLKGNPKPLHLHDWSDLPKVALRLAATKAERKVPVELCKVVLAIAQQEVDRRYEKSDMTADGADSRLPEFRRWLAKERGER